MILPFVFLISSELDIVLLLLGTPFVQYYHQVSPMLNNLIRLLFMLSNFINRTFCTYGMVRRIRDGNKIRDYTILFLGLLDSSSAFPTSLSRKITSLLLMTFFFTRSHSLYLYVSSPYPMNMQGTYLSSSLVLCSFGTCAKALQPNTFRCE